MQRGKAIFFLIVGLLIIIIIFFQLNDANRNLWNFISLVANFLSLYGLLLAYYQILSLRELSEKTQEAVKISSHRLKKVLSISELSKSKKIIEEIQIFLHGENLYGALLRMKDLKEILIQNKYIKDLEPFTSIKQYKTLLINTGIDIDNISDSLINDKEKLDKSNIIKNLEITKSKLIEFENELKNRNDDNR